MRYFLITYRMPVEGLWGQLPLASKAFPSYESIKTHALKGKEFTGKVIILNIFEFKNREDYDSFRGE